MAWHFSMGCPYKLEEEKDERKAYFSFPMKRVVVIHNAPFQQFQA
jgi:hypothetical protein